MSFIAELRQRKVIRVAMVYLVVAWVAIQAASIALPAFDAPSWMLRVVILLFALGFPLALLLTWALELTPDGIKAAPGRIGNKRMAGVAAALMALAVGWYFYGQPAVRDDSARPIKARPVERSIAVLPFVNMSGDKANDYFSDGLAETTLDMLAKVPELKVIARTSSFAFKGKAQDVRQIGMALGVAHLLEGSVQQAGKTLRITVQLVRSSDGSHVWSQQYDRPMADVFKIQDEIATEVVRALQVSLPAAGRAHLLSKRTDNVAAYEEYLKGSALLPGRRVSAMRQALRHFARAIDLDPGYALAYVAASDTIGLLSDYGSVTPAEDEQGERYLARALELAPDLGEAHIARGMRLSEIGDVAGAEREFKRGIALAPGYATAYHWYGMFVASGLDDPERALPLLQHAVMLDPLSPVIRNAYVGQLIDRGRRDQAEAELAKLLADHPDNAVAYSTLSKLKADRGDLVGALQALDRYQALDPSAAGIRYIRCFLLISFGAVTEGKACAQPVIAHDPDQDRVLFWSSFQKILDGDFAAALAMVDKIRQIDPRERAGRLLLAGHAAEALAVLQEAEPEYFKPSITLRSAQLTTALSVGEALLRNGDAARGRTLLRQLLQVSAQDPQAVHRLGQPWTDVFAYALLEEPDNACKSLREAVDHGTFQYIFRLDLDPSLKELRARPCYRQALAPARAKAAAQVAAARAAKLL